MVANTHRVRWNGTVKHVVIERDGEWIASVVTTANPFTNGQAVAEWLNRTMPLDTNPETLNAADRRRRVVRDRH